MMDLTRFLTLENMETMQAKSFGDGYEEGYRLGWQQAIDTFAQLVTGFRELVPGGANRAGVEAFLAAHESYGKPAEVKE